MRQLHILQLYPNEMNTYGDRGNLLVLKKRMQWHGYEPVIHYYHIGGELPETVDIVLGGGGQDSAQGDIQSDILRISDQLHALADKGTPMLMVCGCYQLFGKHFVTQDKQEIQGISIFDIETFGGEKRLIGNVKVKAGEFGTLFGFENHSGRTYLGQGQLELGSVERGNGNNGEDKTEGARTNNVFGTYMHGPVLPNNPVLADGLIKIAATNRYGDFTEKKIDDSLSILARRGAYRRSY
jgi:CobQ-like glutamine amidotransferase family enzyme